MVVVDGMGFRWRTQTTNTDALSRAGGWLAAMDAVEDILHLHFHSDISLTIRAHIISGKHVINMSRGKLKFLALAPRRRRQLRLVSFPKTLQNK